jgi:hypothetical protein
MAFTRALENDNSHTHAVIFQAFPEAGHGIEAIHSLNQKNTTE